MSADPNNFDNKPQEEEEDDDFPEYANEQNKELNEIVYNYRNNLDQRKKTSYQGHKS